MVVKAATTTTYEDRGSSLQQSLKRRGKIGNNQFKYDKNGNIIAFTYTWYADEHSNIYTLAYDNKRRLVSIIVDSFTKYFTYYEDKYC